MAAIYSDASDEVYDLLRSVIADYFSPLAGLPDPGLRIQIRMAVDPKTGIGVKFHGHAAAAKIKLVKAEERALWTRSGNPASTFPDFRLFIDSDIWASLSERQKVALLWHEVNHILPVRNKKSGELRYDDYGRIKFKLKLDDFMLTGFFETIEIFGADALEYESLESVLKKLEKLSKSPGKLPFGDAPRPSKKPRKADSPPVPEEAA